jgi:predicted cupin superfamily sugar epimerase
MTDMVHGRQVNDEARTVIDVLGLAPHPEGGHYAETWRGEPGPDGRAIGTAIHFLLAAGERSHWHRVDATEIWHFNAGAPLRLRIADDDGDESGWREIVLGPDIAGGQRPQATVPAHAWQSAEPLGAWSLVSCTVTPGFEFEHFELAPPGWSPG